MADEAGEFIQKGIQYAKTAIQLDTEGKFADALKYYEYTLQALNRAIQLDTNEQRRAVTSKKSAEYVQRRRQLESRMQGGGGGGGAAAAAPAAAAANWNAPAAGAAGAGPGYAHGAASSGSGGGGGAAPARAMALWVTDSPVIQAHLAAARAASHDAIVTSTFGEGMQVLRKNTVITHVVNNVHRAGGKLEATHELIDLVKRYDPNLPIVLTTFEVDEKTRNKKSFAKRMVELKELLQGCMRMGAAAVANSVEELCAVLADPRFVRHGAGGGGGGDAGGAAAAGRSRGNSGTAAAVSGGGGAATASLQKVAADSANKPQGKAVFNDKGLDYYVGAKIGSGNFGVIHDCKDGFGQDFVIKVLKTNRPIEEVQQDWAKEVQFLFTLNHPNIIQLYDAFEYKNLYHLVMERAHGSLRDYIKAHGAMSGPDVVNVAGQILSGLSHIHIRNIIHRDLHVDNVLYSSARHAAQKIAVKITDFGISKMLKPDENAAITFIGRDYDYSPELVTRGQTTKKSDLYQLGLILYYLYTGQPALSPADGKNVVQLVTSGQARSRCESLNTKLGDVISVLLRRAPEYRFRDCADTWKNLSAIL